MKRLLLLLAVTLALLGAETTFNWWVDPFGEFWKPGAVAQASRSNCLVSEELIGNAYLPFKLDVFRRRPTRTFVIGSSRVLKIGPRPGERTFSNLGVPALAPDDLLYLLQHVPRDAPRQTVYLGVEVYWFNPSYHPFDFRPGFYAQARYVLSRATFKASVDILRSAHYVLLHRWRRERLGPRCVIGRASPGIAWNLDGTRVWGFELQPGAYRPGLDRFSTDLHHVHNGYLADWPEFSEARLRTLARALAVAHARHWRVVGFAPPEASRFARFFAANRSVGPKWKEFGRVMPRLFHRYGFGWLDLRDVRSVPCSQHDFVDGSFHPNARCSMRIRRRLDREAATLASR